MQLPPRGVALDDVDGLAEIVGVERHVARVRHLEGIEGRGAGGHAVGAHQHGLGADLARPVARADAVAGADVERHPRHREGGIGKTSDQRCGEADAPEPRRVGAAQRTQKIGAKPEAAAQ